MSNLAKRPQHPFDFLNNRTDETGLAIFDAELNGHLQVELLKIRTNVIIEVLEHAVDREMGLVDHVRETAGASLTKQQVGASLIGLGHRLVTAAAQRGLE